MYSYIFGDALIAALLCARCQESTLEAREVKPKFVDGAFVSASFGVPVRSTTRMVIKGEPMYDALPFACACLTFVCWPVRLHGCTLLGPSWHRALLA